MELNQKPVSERTHIAFFGIRNAGKSSLVNAVTNQQISLVSNVLGTTTDPVSKTMELLPIGPVLIIDTPGIDDEGDLGLMRVERAKEVLNKTDIGVLVTDCTKELCEKEKELIKAFEEKNIKYIIVKNKCDLIKELPKTDDNEIFTSAAKNINIEELKNLIGKLSKEANNSKPLVCDLVKNGDLVVLVTPIDSAAPKGRLILPQQQVIRELLESGAIPVVTKETELEITLNSLKVKPKLVITDSQAFDKVNNLLPYDIPLTSFSILFARYKGNLVTSVKGAAALDKLNNGDTVLISEGCTHHRQCGDIGTVKLPFWIQNHCKKNINFEFTSGGGFKKDLTKYALIIHCGGCMLTEKEMKYRYSKAQKQEIPITNYGIAIAHTNGILKRSVELFPDVLKLL